MRDIPLGTLIHRAGLVGVERLEEALAEGNRTGKRLGEILVDRGWIEDRDLARLLAGQQGLPFVELGSAPIDREAMRLLPQPTAQRLCALAIGFEEGLALVAVADPADQATLAGVREALGTDARFAVAARSELTAVLKNYGQILLNGSARASVATAPVGHLPVEPRPAAAPVRGFRVVVRLTTDEWIDVLSFEDRGEAVSHARGIVNHIRAAEGGDWPLVAGRYVRPDSIVSVDVVQ